MAKRTIEDETYGLILYKEEYWEKKDKLVFGIQDRKQEIKVEIDIFSIIYEEKKLGLLDDELLMFYAENPELIDEENAKNIECRQKKMFQKICYSKDSVIKNLEEAALKKREEILEGQTVESFSKIVGKEKAQRCFAAKAREEKLASLELKKMRIFKDCIEIKCTCDWFKPSGGFSIFEDGSVEMVYVDSLSF